MPASDVPVDNVSIDDNVTVGGRRSLAGPRQWGWAMARLSSSASSHTILSSEAASAHLGAGRSLGTGGDVPVRNGLSEPKHGEIPALWEAEMREGLSMPASCNILATGTRRLEPVLEGERSSWNGRRCGLGVKT